jgi:hypothetical protein
MGEDYGSLGSVSSGGGLANKGPADKNGAQEQEEVRDGIGNTSIANEVYAIVFAFC